MSEVNYFYKPNRFYGNPHKVDRANVTWYVNGVPMPPPKEIGWSIQDLYAPGSGRLLDGNMQFQFVSSKRKLEIQYNNTDTQIYRQALAAVSGGGFRSITYWDLIDNGWRTSTMYVGDRKGKMLHFLPDRKIMGPLSFNLIER